MEGEVHRIYIIASQGGFYIATMKYVYRNVLPVLHSGMERL